MALSRADAAAERLLRGDRCVTLPEERLDDHRTAAGRAGARVELAHRDAVRRPDERALPDPIERAKHFVSGRREGDHSARPLAERIPRPRDTAPVGALGGVGRRPRVSEWVEDHAASRCVRAHVEIREREGERRAEAIERTGKRKTLERDHGPNTLELAQGSVKSTALRWSTIAATVLPSCDIATSLIAPPAPSSSTAPSPGANARRRSVPSSTIGRRAAIRRRPSMSGAFHLIAPSAPIARSDDWSRT